MVLSVSCRWVPAAGWNVARRNVELLRVLRTAVPSFAHGMSADDLQVKQMTGGMTNTVLRCSGPGVDNEATKHVLLRIDGRGTDCLFDRSTGVVAQRVLSVLGLVPRILGEFKNGRVEEFLSASTLTSENLRETDISKAVASTLARTHVESTPAISKPDSQPLMDRLKSWYFTAVTSCGDLCAAQGIDMQNLGFALKKLEAPLEAMRSPLVFAHGDLQHGNIMMENGPCGPKIFLIDYDFDKVADAHHQQVENLPTQSQKETFCESYLIAQDGRPGWHPTRAQVLSLVAEADAYAPVSNLHWGLWGLVQAARNDCSNFDYGAYGAQRINSFLRQFTPRVVGPEASLVSIGEQPQHSFVYH